MLKFYVATNILGGFYCDCYDIAHVRGFKKKSNSVCFDIEVLTEGSKYLRNSAIMDTDIRVLITQLLLVHVLRDVKPNATVRNICPKL